MCYRRTHQLGDLYGKDLMSLPATQNSHDVRTGSFINLCNRIFTQRGQGIGGLRSLSHYLSFLVLRVASYNASRTESVLVSNRGSLTVSKNGASSSYLEGPGFAIRQDILRVFVLELLVVQTGFGTHPASYPMDTGGKEAGTWSWPLTSN
jgi:hypothetical protein